MFIKVDSREKDLQNKLSYYIASIPAFRNLKIVVENLPIGDVIISNNNDDELIIERKSVNDLLSSIKDGRGSQSWSKTVVRNRHVTHARAACFIIR